MISTSKVTPGRLPPPSQIDFWSKKINIVGHCALCLAKIRSGSRWNLEHAPSIDHLWPYLRENWCDDFSAFDFIVGAFLESKVPIMCTLCRDSIKTLDKLHQELVNIQKSIDNQVNGIRGMMESNDFEKECADLANAMDKAKVPLTCVENTVNFLNQLHGKNSRALENFLDYKRRIEPQFETVADQISCIASSILGGESGIEEPNLPDQAKMNPESSVQSAHGQQDCDPSSSKGALNQIVKTEVESDYEAPYTPIEDENFGNDSPGHQSQTTREKALSRGIKRTAKHDARSEGDDSEYVVSEEDISDGTDSDMDGDDGNNNDHERTKGGGTTNDLERKTSTQNEPGSSTSKAETVVSKKRPSRKPRKRPRRSDTKISYSEEDSRHTAASSGVEDNDFNIDPTDLDGDEEEEDPKPKPKSKRSRSRRKSSSSSSPVKLGRPRKHPPKEAKAPIRNTLCEICCERLPDRFKLFEHLQSHVKDFACQCATCGTAYYSRKRMESKHYKKAKRCMIAAGIPLSSAERLKKCDTCGFETDSYLTLKSHLMEHEIPTEKNCQCPLPDCSESFTVRQLVEFHLDKHALQGTSSAASQKCPICSEAIEYAKMDMRVHLETVHNVVETIACNYCPHVFHDLESLVEHLIPHLSEGVCCHICSDQIQYYKADHIRAHYYTHHQVGTEYVCESCDYRTFSKGNLRGHQAQKHEGKHRKTFTCQLCTNPPVVCRSKDNLVTHNIQVHGAQPYQCKFCERTFDNKTTWMRHERGHFGITQRKHQCPHCPDKAFNILARLEFHLKRVHGDKPAEKNFKCDQCDKCYWDNHALKRHVEAVHLGITYMCEECGRNFREPGPLKNHMRRHTGERPYKCSFCPNDFRYKDAHRRHEESHIRLGDKFQPGRTFDRKKCH